MSVAGLGGKARGASLVWVLGGSAGIEGPPAPQGWDRGQDQRGLGPARGGTAWLVGLGIRGHCPPGCLARPGQVGAPCAPPTRGLMASDWLLYAQARPTSLSLFLSLSVSVSLPHLFSAAEVPRRVRVGRLVNHDAGILAESAFSPSLSPSLPFSLSLSPSLSLPPSNISLLSLSLSNVSFSA